jgi:hypothetical protein
MRVVNFPDGHRPRDQMVLRSIRVRQEPSPQSKGVYEFMPIGTFETELRNTSPLLLHQYLETMLSSSI